MIELAEELSALRGCTFAQLGVRVEFPELLAWWRKLGYNVLSRGDLMLQVGRELPVAFEVPTADEMVRLVDRTLKEKGVVYVPTLSTYDIMALISSLVPISALV